MTNKTEAQIFADDRPSSLDATEFYGNLLRAIRARGTGWDK